MSARQSPTMRRMRTLGRSIDQRASALIEWLMPRVDDLWGCQMPGIAAVVVLILVPGLLGWIPSWYLAPELGVLAIGFAVGLAWIAQLRREGQQRDLLNWTSDLRRLDSDEFEWLVGELFKREGWTTVERTGSQSHGDGNIDLIVSRDTERCIVQCKRWEARRVGVDIVRAFAGTYPPGGNVTGRVLVTLSDFTDDARTAAERARVILMDGRELTLRLQAVRRSEACERCGSPMRLDKSTYGWWLHCLVAGCPGKRDLSRDPGRAIDLLLAQPDRR